MRHIINKEIISSMMAACMLASEYEQDIDWVFIENEYNLIQQKKSKLSRKERKAIIDCWENKSKNVEK